LISDAEAAVIAEFHAKLVAYRSPNKNDYDHEAIISDVNWQAVVAAAAVARDRLLLLIADPAEVKDLTQPSIHAVQAAQQKPPEVR
jgi:hypothetical protein